MKTTNTIQRTPSSEARHFLLKSITLALVLVLCMTVVMAADGTSGAIEDGVKAGLASVYGIIKAITIPVAAVSLAFCAFQIFTGGERGMEVAKKTALYTVIAVGIVYLAPVVVEQVGSWFANRSSTRVFD